MGVLVFLTESFFDNLFKQYPQFFNAEKLSKLSVIAAVFTSLTLIILKFLAWRVTASFTIQASLLDSAMDAITSFFAVVALMYSFKKADADHGFGHGKIEGIVSLVQVVFMTIACCSLLKDAWDGFNGTGDTIDYPIVGIIVMTISSAIVYTLVKFQSYVAQKTHSTVVESDSIHYAADLYMNIGAMFSFVLSNFIPYLDAVCGIAVCIYVMIGIIKVFSTAMADLMDAELPESERNAIKNLVENNSDVIKLIHIKTRRSGTKKIAHIDVIINKNHTFVDAHNISKRIEESVSALFFHSEIVVRVIPSE